MVDRHHNLSDAIDGTIRLESDEKTYGLADEAATLVTRPRGWHLVERHVHVTASRSAPRSSTARSTSSRTTSGWPRPAPVRTRIFRARVVTWSPGSGTG